MPNARWPLTGLLSLFISLGCTHDEPIQQRIIAQRCAELKLSVGRARAIADSRAESDDIRLSNYHSSVWLD